MLFQVYIQASDCNGIWCFLAMKSESCMVISLCLREIFMLVSTRFKFMQSKLINVFLNNLLKQKQNKLAIGFLCHLQAYKNYICRLVCVPVGIVRSEYARGVGCAGKWYLKAKNLKTLGNSTTSGKITSLLK